MSLPLAPSAPLRSPHDGAASCSGRAVLRVALLDDHAAVRAGCRRWLELAGGVCVTEEHASAESLLTAWRGAGAPPCDVLVLDLSLRGVSGLDLLHRLRLRWPALGVLVYSMHESPTTAALCLRLGARGYVTKVSDPERLVAAVRAVADGATLLSPDLGELAPDAARVPAHHGLSVREIDVLNRLLAGRSAGEIARGMCLSPKTVANYQSAIRRKLGVHNDVELLRYARLHGLGVA